mmetsp:Transcript_3655/g.13501  ORF Transcript_3655/g.13501 Transcript_3655/m.13501 type:complete len:328 (-) Transcript_3655:379-1362(-)
MKRTCHARTRSAPFPTSWRRARNKRSSPRIAKRPKKTAGAGGVDATSRKRNTPRSARTTARRRSARKRSAWRTARTAISRPRTKPRAPRTARTGRTTRKKKSATSSTGAQTKRGTRTTFCTPWRTRRASAFAVTTPWDASSAGATSRSPCTTKSARTTAPTRSARLISASRSARTTLILSAPRTRTTSRRRSVTFSKPASTSSSTRITRFTCCRTRRATRGGTAPRTVPGATSAGATKKSPRTKRCAWMTARRSSARKTSASFCARRKSSPTSATKLSARTGRTTPLIPSVTFSTDAPGRSTTTTTSFFSRTTANALRCKPRRRTSP